jgi:nicotinamide riboside kinase
MTTKFLIDGVDRLGKSTLAKTIMDQLGYHLYVHYDKPKALSFYGTDINRSKEIFQRKCNDTMFNLLRSPINIVVDRTHLGEMVYAPLYRGYSGDYVYSLEEDLLCEKPYTAPEEIKLILLITSNFDFITDDGQSFDFSKKEDEQRMFIKAWEQSKLSKVMIDVYNGNGGYKNSKDIFEEIMSQK